MPKIRRFDWTLILTALATGAGCGGGCEGMEPTPGGFPSNERSPNAMQIRVSQSGFQTIADDPAGLLAGLTGGPLEFDVPASCGGTPAVCCPGGTPQSPCGPVVLDLSEHPGDTLPRMQIQPRGTGPSRMDITVRTRIQTVEDLPVEILGSDCGVAIDTEPGPHPHVKLDIPINFPIDPMSNTTRVEAGDAVIGANGEGEFTEDDVTINGPIFSLCTIANFGIGAFIDQITGLFTDQIKDAVSGQTCKQCPSGQVSECGPFASACTDNVCMRADDTCVQELGIAGRLSGGALFGGFSPGTLGKMDLYEVAGGYATTNDNGLSLGMLGGMLPAGTPHDRCGPPATAPAMVSIPQSDFFRDDSRPDGGPSFHFALGMHESQLDELAYGLYDGGLLCLTVGTRTVDLLTTSTLALIAPSISNLSLDAAPVGIGLRPQSPPTIVLGLNTFRDEMGEQVVDEPLLDITFTGMELDFYAMIEHQYIRLFTLVADVRLPIGLQIGDGELVPMIGDADNAFTNLTVKNSEALTESPDELAQTFPTILDLALPMLGSGLGGFQLPDLGGLSLEVTEITAVDNKTFMAIFANLAPLSKPARAETRVRVTGLEEPDHDIATTPSRWSPDLAPKLDLELTGDGMEWSFRIDGGLWSGWSAETVRTLSPRLFWLPGLHEVEVRARYIGQPSTVDATPQRIVVPIGPGAEPVAIARESGFHGQAGEGGCNCATGGSPEGALPIVVAGLIVIWPRRRKRTRMSWLWAAALVVAVGATVPACSCGSNPCGDQECLPGEVEMGAIGRYNGAATDGTRSVVSTYDEELGDLVVVEVNGTDLTYTAVDGVPLEDTPVYHPDGYRGGIEGAGENVGVWSSIALYMGDARVAYQDKNNGTLRVAIESRGRWSSYDIGDGGTHASIAISSSGAPLVAHLVLGVADGAQRNSELRLARAANANPESGEWTTTVLATAPSTCAGLCDTGQACVAPDVAGDPETCVSTTSDCAPACADDEACVSGACRAAIPDPAYVDLPVGAGLFPTVLVLPDGRIAVVHYDRVRTALILLVESSAGSLDFQETILDGAGPEDRGQWASAVADGVGNIYVAYQDALADQLYFVSWNGSPTAPEIVDDGMRDGDFRPHPVGAGAAMFLSNGTPGIAYQDGLTADLMIATRSGTWTYAPQSSGALLDGFHIAASGSLLVWDQLDITRQPPSGLMVKP
jgi:MYXO-CTERM domain-containing protein